MTSTVELLIAGLTSGLVVSLAALAVTLVFGIARFANAATGDVMAAGAYATFFGAATTGSMLLGAVFGAAVGALLGVAGYWLVFRKLSGRSSVTALLASIGTAFFIRAVIGFVFSYDQKTFPLPLVRPWRVLDVRLMPTDVDLALVALGTLAVTFLILHATPIGCRMRAVADDIDLARVSGISPSGVMFAMWALAGTISAIAGIMLGVKTVITPEMGWEMLLPAFAAAILGGIGNPVGAVVAGLLLGVVQEMSTPYVGFTYKLAISFAVLLAVLLLRPQGLFGRVEGAR
jgi:branched-chain amino acid transport system permease protein